jgi:putative amide transporter protein
MLLGVVLLYVGVVLIVNGIWLVGQARVASSGSAERGAAAAEAQPTFMQGREVAVINVFTGFVGLLVAVTLVVQGNANEDLASIRAAGYIMLFAFTYLWVSANNFLNAGGRAFGWYCLFVAITAIPAGIQVLSNANGNDASIYLGIDWFAWSILWFMFFLLLALDRPIARITGAVAVLEGIGTAWVLGILLLENQLAF